MRCVSRWCYAHAIYLWHINWTKPNLWDRFLFSKLWFLQSSLVWYIILVHIICTSVLIYIRDACSFSGPGSRTVRISTRFFLDNALFVGLTTGVGHERLHICICMHAWNLPSLRVYRKGMAAIVPLPPVFAVCTKRFLSAVLTNNGHFAVLYIILPVTLHSTICGNPVTTHPCFTICVVPGTSTGARAYYFVSMHFFAMHESTPSGWFEVANSALHTTDSYCCNSREGYQKLRCRPPGTPAAYKH